jgi:hypothetical protein
MRAPRRASDKLLAPLATSATPIVIRHSGARIAGLPWPAPERKGLKESIFRKEYSCIVQNQEPRVICVKRNL